MSSKGETTETYLYDGRGSVVGTVGANSEFVSYSYTAYGELMPNSPQPKVFDYNGEATDFGSGMQYLRARYYDTEISRFFQEDDYRGKFTNPISMNRYAYVHNNPVMGVDPSGYRPIDHGPTVVIPKPVSVYDAKMTQIEKIIEDGFVNDEQGNGNSAPADNAEDVQGGGVQTPNGVLYPNGLFVDNDGCI